MYTIEVCSSSSHCFSRSEHFREAWLRLISGSCALWSECMWNVVPRKTGQLFLLYKGSLMFGAPDDFPFLCVFLSIIYKQIQLVVKKSISTFSLSRKQHQTRFLRFPFFYLEKRSPSLLLQFHSPFVFSCGSWLGFVLNFLKNITFLKSRRKCF